jgi:hypothetical protein
MIMSMYFHQTKLSDCVCLLSNSKFKTAIDRQWLPAKFGVNFNVPNLATNDLLDSCPNSTTDDMQLVIQQFNESLRT